MPNKLPEKPGEDLENKQEGDRDATTESIRAATLKKIADILGDTTKNNETKEKEVQVEMKKLSDPKKKPTDDKDDLKKDLKEPVKLINNAPVIAASKTFGTQTAEAAGAAAKLAVPTGLVATAASIEHWPILGKIPYLPEAAQWIQKGILSASDFLGMNTGTLAAVPHSWLATLHNFVGPTAVAAGGLWGLGKFNEWLTGREKSGFNILKTMWNGVRSVYDLPKAGLGKVWGWASSPFTRKENILNRSVIGLKNIVRDWAWNPIIKPVISPTKLGVGTGILGALLGNAATGGSPLIIAGTLYGIGNYLTNRGHLAGAAGAAGAPQP